jgi:hypothetical protein
MSVNSMSAVDLNADLPARRRLDLAVAAVAHELARTTWVDDPRCEMPAVSIEVRAREQP